MVTLLEKAFREVKKLLDIEQSALAKWVLDELESERKWDNVFAESEEIRKRA